MNELKFECLNFCGRINFANSCAFLTTNPSPWSFHFTIDVLGVSSIICNGVVELEGRLAEVSRESRASGLRAEGMHEPHRSLARRWLLPVGRQRRRWRRRGLEEQTLRRECANKLEADADGCLTAAVVALNQAVRSQESKCIQIEDRRCPVSVLYVRNFMHFQHLPCCSGSSSASLYLCPLSENN